MKRRDVIKGGIGVLGYSLAGPVLAARPCPPALIGTSPVNCPPPPAPPGPISVLSETMAPGSWEELGTTSGLGDIARRYLDGEYGQQQGNRGFFEFATHGIWIEDVAELHFRGSGHQSGGIHIRYSETTGTWEHQNSFPAWEHQYDHTAYDQVNNRMFATTPAGCEVQMWPYSSGAGSWEEVADRIGSLIIAEGLAWFPDANDGAGGLVHYGSYAQDGSQTGGIRLSNPNVTNWSWVDGNFFSSNGSRYHLNATYLHAERVVLCGGGNAGSDAVSMDAAGRITARNRLPAHWGPSDNDRMGTVLSDSVTGRIFFVSCDDNAIYEHDYAGDQWNEIASLPTSGPRSFATMISTYGVIMLVAGASTDTNPRIWLFKL